MKNTKKKEKEWERKRVASGMRQKWGSFVGCPKEIALLSPYSYILIILQFEAQIVTIVPIKNYMLCKRAGISCYFLFTYCSGAIT